MVSSYNQVLSSTLDCLAPLKTRTVTFSHTAPWYTPQLRSMKAKGRQLERMSKRTGLTVHAEALKDHLTVYRRALSQTKSSYYAHLIAMGEGNPKALFTTINRLLQPPASALHSSSSSDLCNRFVAFFQHKIDAIYEQLQPPGPSPPPGPTLLLPTPPNTSPTPRTYSVATCPAPIPHCSFPVFSPLDAVTISKIVSGSKPSTCALDPMPTSLVKSSMSALCPLMTAIINSSLSTGSVPHNLKIASVTPILKKPGLDPDNLNNYRPISNLPFLSKILERAVASQLQSHMSLHQLYDPLQSGFRAKHSTETALVRVVNDLLMANDSGSVNILILLDLSAAFDTISHSVLLNRLEKSLGIIGTPLAWFKSYLSGRRQYVSLGGSRSASAPVKQGVPQGSVLGPLLFTIYLLPLGQIIRKHGLNYHCYADDTQIYLHTKPSAPLPPPSLIACLREIKDWMTTNFLKLNSNKTELMVVAPKSTLQKTGNLILSIDGCSICPSSQVRNLGVLLDPSLSFESHIKSVTKSAFFQLRNISRLRPSLSDTSAETLIHAFVTSRLDYCNGVLYGVSSKTLARLQYVQNSAARILTRTKPWQHITPTLQQLHWLPIKHCITFKVLLLTYKSLHGLAPSYLSDLLHPYTPTRGLRSSDAGLLSTPHSKRSTISDRAFSVVAPRLWNSLPPSIRDSDSISLFKTRLKTHLFRVAFPQHGQGPE